MSKALTVKQPWAWAIIHGGKNVENRSRRTWFRGRLYIHAGKSAASEALEFPAMRAALSENIPVAPGMPAGFVIGTVALVGVHHADECAMDDDEGRRVYCSEWAMADHFHWVLFSPQPIAEPFEVRGQLGIWSLDTEETVA